MHIGLLQEAGESALCRLVVRLALQLRSEAFGARQNASDGRWHEKCLFNGLVIRHRTFMRRPNSASGKRLKALWKIEAQQARYHFDGKFFMMLDCFPGALCDPNGFVVFDSKQDLFAAEGVKAYDGCQRIFVADRIPSLAGYTKAPASLAVKI